MTSSRIEGVASIRKTPAEGATEREFNRLGLLKILVLQMEKRLGMMVPTPSSEKLRGNIHTNLTPNSNQVQGIAKPSNNWNTSEKHQANTNLPNEVREAILNSIGTKWKNWKYRVKQMYLKTTHDVEKLQQAPDERIEPQ
ncbi:hypothetical protein ACH5RR_006746 [Cinchona calisaya]|uniref:Uncharacterized protein n=1 Tax=Cinchona calisaya TaxID=153742 RepID=A0ABD3APW8_9GENT